MSVADSTNSGGRRVSRCPGSGLAATDRPRPLPPTARSYLWTCHFVFIACAIGQQMKCLTVIDERTREALFLDVTCGIRSTRVIEVLAKPITVHGAPKYLGPGLRPGVRLRGYPAMAV